MHMTIMKIMNMKKWQRRCFTLLETLIALALTVIALTTLLFFYQETVTLSSQAEKLEKESFQMRYIESKFSFLFPRTYSQTQKKNFFFFTSRDPGGLFAQGNPQSLIFTYDHGVDLSKQFSNQILAQLFVDAKNRLCLASWPIPSRWMEGVSIPMKFEVLLEGVEKLKFWFFIAPDRKWDPSPASSQPNPNPNPPPNPQPGSSTSSVEVVVNPSPEGEWIDYWNQDYKQLPAIIKIEIKRKGKTEFFSFPLSQCRRQPVYIQ
jgi:hypothetical protein